VVGRPKLARANSSATSLRLGQRELCWALESSRTTRGCVGLASREQTHEVREIGSDADGVRFGAPTGHVNFDEGRPG
jgi:hypothetical protein